MGRQEKINDFHSRLLAEFTGGNGFLVSGWSSEASQRERFNALIRTSRFSGGSVVDYGCGPGDLHRYLSTLGYDFDYIGYDQNKDMIDTASREHSAKFAHLPLDSDDFPTADYIFCSGIFQFYDDEDEEYYIKLIRRLFVRSKICFAFNMLSSLRSISEKASDELYLAPENLVGLMSKITRRWVVDHSYHPGFGDMTIALYHEAQGEKWQRPRF